MDEEKRKQWEKVNSEDHKAHKRLIASIKRDKKRTSQERKDLIEQLNRARTRQFFETRMKYLGH